MLEKQFKLKLEKSIFLIPILILVATTTYAYADSMQGGSMMHGSNMSGGSWGNNSTMMNDHSMTNGSMMNNNIMSAGSIDLSTATLVDGSKNAPVTIVEFGDYQCPKCDAWFKNEEPTIKANYIDTNKAKLVFVDFPFLGPDSQTAAQATFCAGEQGKYSEFHNILYTNQGGIQSGWANAAALKQFASTLGLDTNQFNSCLDSAKYASMVSHNKDVGTAQGVQGTPVFFIIGPDGKATKIEGPQPAAAFATVIDSISTQATPEFGPIVSMILAISIITIIAVSAKTGIRFRQNR